jgi:hypothetical protein
MNPNTSNLLPNEENRFDRLADGELSESERRSLLASLDAEPDGWRRCALAFLEAQTWRESLGDVTPPAQKRVPLPFSTSPSPVPTRKKTLGAMGTVMAMAASFLVALGLGGWLLRSPPAGGSRPSPDLVAHDGASKTLPGGAASKWETVELRAPHLTGSEEPVQLAATRRDRLDDEYWKTVPSPVPNNVLEALKRLGCEVRIQRELVPSQLPDGNRLVVPVDNVKVEYGHNQPYQ